MKLNLTKPIIFFDLETTGLKISTDRIIELAAIKILPDGNKKTKTWLLNPTIPIPKEVSEIHGFTNENIKEKPTFKDKAIDIFGFFAGCDLGGYNSDKFDIPLLAEEFIRVDLDFNLDNRNTIDIQNIFHKLEKRTLTAAYKFYCNKNLDNAHSAMADTTATYEILLAQISKYEEIENNIESLSKFSNLRGECADLAGFIKFNNDGDEVLSFGKYRNVSLKEIWEKNPGYFSWISNADFPMFTKKIIKNFVVKMKLENKFKS